MTPIRSRRRPGFTLIELLIVIIVIGILVALLIPAIIGAIRTANDATVIGEETQLVNALNAFKEKYGSYPPSRIMLNETLPFQQYGSITGTTAMGSASTIWLNGNGPPSGVSDTAGGNDITVQQLAQRSGSYMLKFFPRAKPPTTTTTAPNTWNDFNGNGAPDYSGTPGVTSANWIYLEGHECLVFFLGGIANITANANGTKSGAMTGFGRDPSAPFTYPGDALTVSGGSFPNLSAQMVSLNRAPAFYEFNNGRLGDDDLDGMLDYADSLTPAASASNLNTQVPVPLGGGNDRSPYVYFSSYEGAGYDPNDANSLEPTPNYAGPLLQKFRVTLGLSSGFTASASPNPYTSSAPVPSTGTPAVYVNKDSFQIISAGRDRIFGVGGQYNINSSPRLVFDTTSGDTVPNDPGVRTLTEADNLTNFNNSKLD